MLVSVFGACDTMRHVKCDDMVLAKLESPGQQFVAVSYRRSCANNTGLYSVVSLQDLHASSRDQGAPETILTLSGYHDVSVTWTGPNTLQITSPALADSKTTMTRVEAWRGITISF